MISDYQQFAKSVGDEFSLLIEGRPALSLVLREVSALPSPSENALAEFPNLRSRPFWLLLGNPTGFLVSQKTKRLRHEVVGE